MFPFCPFCIKNIICILDFKKLDNFEMENTVLTSIFGVNLVTILVFPPEQGCERTDMHTLDSHLHFFCFLCKF